MLRFVLVPMLAELLGEIATPTTLPLAFADALVETPVFCCKKPGALNWEVPLKRCAKNPLVFHRTDTSPGGPANVEKLGFPTVFVLSWRDLPPPLRSRFGISPLPSKNWQLKN